MIPITIDPQLTARLPRATLGCIQCTVAVAESGPALLGEIDALCRQLVATMTIDQFLQ